MEEEKFSGRSPSNWALIKNALGQSFLLSFVNCMIV